MIRCMIVLMTLVLTTGLLYLVGHLFTIPFFMFNHQYTDHSNGLYITSGSLIPFIMGLMASFLAEKIYIHKYRQKLG
ncbi:hypothetical protein ACFPOH_06725 [Ureibacillus suwonensis]|uniref:Uncharacterized protein n=1 Tax=Ureibacillus suwonensis TaxID=313007 RepID=A0ABW0RA92_9BACL